MFGFLALGFFTAIAFGNMSNGGGTPTGGILGGIVASLFAIKQIKEYLKDLGWVKDKKKEEEEDDDDDNKSRKKDNDIEEDDDFGIKGLDETGADDDDPKLMRNRGLAMMKAQVDSLDAEDHGEEAEKTRTAYNEYIKCLYNPDGSEKSEDEINDALGELKENNKSLFDAIEEQTKSIAKDKDAMDDFVKQYREINPNQAAAAAETAAADRIEIQKNEEVAQLEQERDEKIQEAGDDEDRVNEIKEEYKNKIENVKSEKDDKINSHRDKAKELKDKPYSKKPAREDPIIADGLEELRKNREERKKLGGDNGLKEMRSKYENFSLGEFSVGDLTNPEISQEKKDRLKEYLDENHIDRDTLIAYNDLKGASSKERESKEKKFKEKLAKQVEKECGRLDSEFEKKKKEIQSKVDKHNGVKTKEPEGEPGGGQGGQGGQGEPGEVITAIKSFKKKEGDKDWIPEIDDDGDFTGNFAVCIVKEKNADGNETLKYVKRDKDGKETSISEDEFNEHKTKFKEWKEDQNPEDENKIDEILDKKYKESEEEKTSEEGKNAERDEKTGKRVNPAKVWHKKKNKSTGKTTKNYYNKNGDSISPDEYHQKIENFKAYVQKHKKQTQQNSSLIDYLTDKLIVERFYPNDITNYLKKFM